MRIRVLAPFLLSAAFAAAAAEPAPPSKCSDSEHRRLDFWVGDWDAFEVGGGDKPIARARIDVILDGCGLREVYEQNDGLVGQSFTTYDAARKNWHQTWLTNGGALLQIDGRFDGNSLTLQGPRWNATGGKEIVRGVWRPENGGVREVAHTSVDGGKTWRPWFDVFFRRHADTPGAGGASDGDDAATTRVVEELNRGYVDAFLKSDAAWYREHLADDFVCIVSDGSVLDRDQFLVDAAKGPGVRSYTLHDVKVRTYGSVAVVQARGEYTRPDGTAGQSRYIDVWVLRDGKWKTVSAQITRISPPK
jgi:ketosteroid isomerase-like protein